MLMEHLLMKKFMLLIIVFILIIIQKINGIVLNKDCITNVKSLT